MKTKKLFITLLMIISFATKAQFVTIPDANFVAYLQLNYPTCMNGNLMDTTCTAITSATTLNFQFHSISSLTGLQYFKGLISLTCNYNPLTNLPRLPVNLQYLNCNYNQLTSLPNLPANLQTLWCGNNGLTSLPNLPATIQNLNCHYNLLTNLPGLPANIQTLYCNNNLLTSLPNLPVNIQILDCYNNQLTSLPDLPPTIQRLICYNNQLTSLPSLPPNIQELECNNNNISCFPIFPISINGFQFSITGNPFTCLPNYISVMDANTLAYPLCVNGDSINNPTGCASAKAIVGYTYRDSNSNCIKDNGDLTLNNIPLDLYDSNNTLLAQSYSFSNGIYNFSAALGTYIVKIDTAGFPCNVNCTYPGIDSAVVLSNANPLAQDINFNIECKPGFDVGVQSVVPSGWVFPGQPHTLRIVAGDMSQWYNFNCTAGISGQVQITVTGKVTYNGIAQGALTPSISGNVFTYNISDFGTLNIQEAFGLIFTTDTTAQAGDEICGNITVNPVAGDNNPNNNSYKFCYSVINSYDPNMKEVYPVNVSPGFQDWFTYTIHFQNTGTAPAFNIRLTDTLSANLDLETFQVINYSHLNTVALNNNALTFRFPNIMLPDSTTNSEGSKGFVQYRIKPKANLPLGTQIKNTANIYFDYNAPIITNTTLNLFTNVVSVSELENHELQLSIYPNPSSGSYYVKLPKRNAGQLLTMEVYNMLGELILTVKSQNDLTPINLDNQPLGIYILKVNGLNKPFSKRIIKQ
jgi:uncharacterized repeat protein (TIGR01451 family)